MDPSEEEPQTLNTCLPNVQHVKTPPGLKKKNRYFETYISKVLKQVSIGNGITSNSKQQLNSAVCIIAKEISLLAMKLTEFSKKKTISNKEVTNAIKILFSGDLSTNSIREGEKSIKTFNTEIPGSRQGKAGIIFPPSIAEKFLRNFGYSKVMVTSTAPIFLAAVLEYFVAEILILASKYTRDTRKSRITIRDLHLSVTEDKELSALFSKLNLLFLGGGVVPFIHPCLLTKKIGKYKHPKLGSKKIHRFRPGTVAIRDIKKQQKISDCLTFPKLPFEKLVRSICYTINNPPQEQLCTGAEVGSVERIKISSGVFIILQHFIEQYIVSILKDANKATIHAGRVKLMLTDIEFVCNLKGIYISENF